MKVRNSKSGKFDVNEVAKRVVDLATAERPEKSNKKTEKKKSNKKGQ